MTKRWFVEKDGSSIVLSSADRFWRSQREIDEWGLYTKYDQELQAEDFQRLLDGFGAIIEQDDMPTVAQVKEALGL